MSELEKTPYTSLLYGLWIEGAHWDPKAQVLVEGAGRDTITPFPMLVASACESEVMDLEEAANDERNFVDDPHLTKKELRSEKLLAALEKKNESRNVFEKLITQMKVNLLKKYSLPVASKATDEAEAAETKARAERKVYTYRCPVFATTLRLSEMGDGTVKQPVFYLNLRTYEHPRKWIKRSVALLMEVTDCN